MVEVREVCMRLPTQLAGLDLASPLMNGAGTCLRFEDADIAGLLRSATAALVVGPCALCESASQHLTVPCCTRSRRLVRGETGITFGVRDYYVLPLKDTIRATHDAGKPVVVSIVGGSTRQLRALARLCLQAEVDRLELGLDVWGIWESGGGYEPFVADLDRVESALIGLETELGTNAAPLLVRLPAIDEISDLETLVLLMATYPFVQVVVVNTQSTDHSRLSVSSEEVLAQQRRLRRLLPERVQLVDAGVIASGPHVRDCLCAGATGVEIGPEIFSEGLGVFARLANELGALPERS